MSNAHTLWPTPGIDAMRDVFRIALAYGCNGRARFQIAGRFRQIDPLGYAILAGVLGRDPHARVKAVSVDEAVAVICQRLVLSPNSSARLTGLRWLEDPSQATATLCRTAKAEEPRVARWKNSPPRRHEPRSNPRILWEVDFHGEREVGTEPYWWDAWDEPGFLARERDAMWEEIERLPVGWQDWL